MPVTVAIRSAIRASFDVEVAGDVVRLLEQYGTEDWHGEIERVQSAILLLAAGDVGRVEQLVTAASRDYRDVLYWLELQDKGDPPPASHSP